MFHEEITTNMFNPIVLNGLKKSLWILLSANTYFVLYNYNIMDILMREKAKPLIVVYEKRRNYI